MRVLALLALSGCFLFRGGDGARCPRDRTVVLGTQDEVAAFAGCKRASGVTIRTGATIDLAPLDQLAEIGGDLVIGPTVGFEEVAFHGLARVGGAIHVADNGSTRGLFLPRLADAGRIEIDGNVALKTISVPNHARVAGAFVVTDNRSLELLDASLLVTVGKELVLSGHPKLGLVELGHLAHADIIRIEADPKLPAELVEQLRAKATVR